MIPSAAMTAPSVLAPPAISPRLSHPLSTVLGKGGKRMFGPCNFGGALRQPISSTTGCRLFCLLREGLPATMEPKKTPELHVEDDHTLEMISKVKEMLGSIEDGEISVSAYDTAWVSLVQSLDGNGQPQFPSTLQWIIDNQLPDGSWGDAAVFSAHDRMINTLACVVALSSWRTCPESCDRGLSFLRENMWRLAEEEDELMPIGFEITFPSLLDISKALGLQIPYDDPALNNVHAKRNQKLKRIPKEVLHETPTTLLYSLEGVPGLDWSRILKLQSMDGSFLFCPSSTAYALMQTGNEKCLEYLQRIINKFNGGVPGGYPVDLFEHLWVVDRLERLGISRYFEPEIKGCLDYAYRHWTEDGIAWARNSTVQDVDDTSMGFRLLRLHGYDVSPNVLKNFEKDGEFFCFAGQVNQAVTGIYNLNRASQVMFPGEDILERAKNFSYKFLREKQAANQVVDKWIITKDLPGEVEYALDYPFYASLPRIETRCFIEQYGGGNDVWIGKILYRMPLVNNDLYLDLAKADFNKCQMIHQLEWLSIQKWGKECNLRMHGVTKMSMLKAYFLATAYIFEPDRAAERLGWAKTAILAEVIASYFRSELCTKEARKVFIYNFRNGHINSTLLRLVLHLIAHLSASSARQQLQLYPHQIYFQLQGAWADWMSTWTENKDETGVLLVRTIELCKGGADPTLQPEYVKFVKLISSICSRLQYRIRLLEGNINGKEKTEEKEIQIQMQELVKCVLRSTDDLSMKTKQTFLSIAKSYYYATHCSFAALNIHIQKVLFERIV